MARTDYGAILSTVIQDTSQAIKDVENSSELISPRQWGEHISAFRNKTDSDNVIAQMIEETVSGAIASFTDGANNIPAKEIVCHINPTETGTGEKSPSNPYVIGGFTEANITRTGKNLFDKNTVTYGQFANSSGTISPNSAGCMSDYIEVLPNQPVYARVLGHSTVGFYSFSICKYDENKNFISRSHQYPADAINHQYDIPSNCRYIIFQIALSVGNTITSQNVEDGQIMVSLATLANTNTYEPYTAPTDYNVPFGQTVYGGTLNVTTGVLTKEFNYFRVTMVTGVTDARLARVNLLSVGQPLASGYSLTTNPFVCNIFKSSDYSTSYNNHIHFVNAQSFAIFPVEEIGTEIADWNNWLANNPCYLCYKRKTPIIIQLTPQEVNTLLGANNFYHDCNGDTDVTYRANGELYVEQHPEPGPEPEPTPEPDTQASSLAPLSLNDTIEEQEEE